MAKEITGRDRLLLDQITRGLKSDGQYAQHFDENDVGGINLVRTLGR